MQETTGQRHPKRRRKPARDAAEFGNVTVVSNPGPDAEDRLRRFITLMIKHATEDGSFSNDSDPSLHRDEGDAGTPERGSPSLGGPEADE